MTNDMKKAFDDINEEHFNNILNCLEQNGFICNCIDGNCGRSRYYTIRELPKIFLELCKKFNLSIDMNIKNFYITINDDHCLVAYNEDKYNEDEVRAILLMR